MNPDNNDSSTSLEVVEPVQVQDTSSEEDIVEILNNLIVLDKNRREEGKEIDPTIPWDRATWSWEYRKCGRQYCNCKLGGDYRHGPYLVMVWKDLDSKQYRNKVKKKYLGKSKDLDIDKVLSDLSLKKSYEKAGIINRNLTFIKLRKGVNILKAARSGNKLAQEYHKKIEADKVSTDWAYKKVFKLNQTEK